MAIANQENALLLTTGNKSELATGYCTLYGDMCGAFNPIKDLYKTQVYELMRFINEFDRIKIPHNILEKEPSAELRPNQKDSDTIPPYSTLDAILYEMIENRKTPEDIVGFDRKTIEKVWKLFKGAEYKRQQACIGVKVSERSFESHEWRFNI